MDQKIRNIAISGSQTQKDREIHFEEIYKEYFDRLFSYARVICDSEELAKDIVADFFYGLLKKNTDLAKVDNLSAYLFVGVKNLCIQRLMKASKLENASVSIATIDYVDPQQVLLGKELKKLLNEIVDNLPDQCQLIFRMSKEQGMSNQEISTELSIGVGTVKTQLIRAQSKLREKITQHYKETDANHPNLRLIGQLLLLMAGV